MFCKIVAATLMLATASCGQQSRPKWVRIDGQPILVDPTLLQQAETALTACEGQRAQALMAGSGSLSPYGRQEAAHYVLKGCMADRGYTLAQ